MGVIRNSMAVKRVTRVKKVHNLQMFTEGYKGLQMFRKGYKWLRGLQRVTRGYEGLLGVTGVKKGCRVIQSFT